MVGQYVYRIRNVGWLWPLHWRSRVRIPLLSPCCDSQTSKTLGLTLRRTSTQTVWQLQTTWIRCCTVWHKMLNMQNGNVSRWHGGAEKKCSHEPQSLRWSVVPPALFLLHSTRETFVSGLLSRSNEIPSVCCMNWNMSKKYLAQTLASVTAEDGAPEGLTLMGSGDHMRSTRTVYRLHTVHSNMLYVGKQCNSPIRALPPVNSNLIGHWLVRFQHEREALSSSGWVSTVNNETVIGKEKRKKILQGEMRRRAL